MMSQPLNAPRRLPSSPTVAFYRPELDSLRFFAFLAVFAHHSVLGSAPYYEERGVPASAAAVLAAFARGGAFGVDLFLVLSSALITELLTREIELKGHLDVKAFLIRRALRIWPLYIVFLISTPLLDALIHPGQGLGTAQLVGLLAFAGNWVFAFSGYPASVAAPLWSVSVEEQFYLFWAFLLATFGARSAKRVAAVALVVAMCSRVVVAALDLPHPAMWCSTFTRLDPIAAGMVLPILTRGRQWNLSSRARWSLIALGAGIWVAVELVAGVGNRPWVMALAGYPAIAAGSVAIYLGFFSWANPLLSHPALTYLGRISFGLYVFHLVGIHSGIAIAHRFHLPMPSLTHIPISILVTTVAAMLSYRYLESPFLRLKSRFTYVVSRDL